MVEPGETRVKSEEGEEKKCALAIQKKTGEYQCKKACQLRCAGATQESRIFCGQEWARSVPKGNGEFAVVCINNIQEPSRHMEKFEAGQSDNFHTT